jgi:hypothetical protein
MYYENIVKKDSESRTGRKIYMNINYIRAKKYAMKREMIRYLSRRRGVHNLFKITKYSKLSIC